MPKECEITFGVDKCFSVDGVTIKSADGSTIRARKRWINQEVQCTAKIKHVTQRSNYSLKTARRRQELPRHLDLRVWLSATITGLPEIPHPLGELLGRIHSGQDNHLYPATMKYKKDVSTTHVLRGFIYLFIYLFIYYFILIIIILYYQWIFVPVKEFHHNAGRISLHIRWVFTDFNRWINQGLVPRRTRSLVNNVCDLTLVCKGNSSVRIWKKC